MAERLSQQPKAYVLGETEIIKGRKTRFELLLIDSQNKAIMTGGHPLRQLELLEIWNVDRDKIFFFSPDSLGVLVCEVKKTKERSVKVEDDNQEFTAYIIGSHADAWFNNIANTIDLRVVARQISTLR